MGASNLSVLTRYSTPTVANALELFEIRPRDQGFLLNPFCCLLPDAPPVAGYAATCLVSASKDAFGKRDSSEYWKHLEQTPGPPIGVIQDLDPEPRKGSFFGEVNVNIHLAFGAAGVVIDGLARDLPEMAATGLQVLYRAPCVSHAYIHVVDFGRPVTIDGVTIRPGDLLQIDRHGVLIVPPETLSNLEAAIEEIERRERPVIDFCKSGLATPDSLAEMMNRHLRNAPKWTIPQP